MLFGYIRVSMMDSTIARRFAVPRATLYRNILGGRGGQIQAE